METNKKNFKNSGFCSQVSAVLIEIRSFCLLPSHFLLVLIASGNGYLIRKNELFSQFIVISYLGNSL